MSLSDHHHPLIDKDPWWYHRLLMSDASTDGEATVVLPAPGPVTMYVTEGASEEPVARLAAGWNAAGSPVIVDDDGHLRLLDPDESVHDVEW